MKKKIILLLGPKGSGKTYIGYLLQRERNIPFLRVEDIARKVQKGRAVEASAYLSDVFAVIEKGVRQEISHHPHLIFESTGLTEYFDQMLDNLRRDFQVTLIRIRTKPDLCLERVKTRDQSIHINVSDEQVNEINAAVVKKEIKVDGEIFNDNATEQDILNEFDEVMKSKGVQM